MMMMMMKLWGRDHTRCLALWAVTTVSSLHCLPISSSSSTPTSHCAIFIDIHLRQIFNFSAMICVYFSTIFRLQYTHFGGSGPLMSATRVKEPPPNLSCSAATHPLPPPPTHPPPPPPTNVSTLSPSSSEWRLWPSPPFCTLLSRWRLWTPSPSV